MVPVADTMSDLTRNTCRCNDAPDDVLDAKQSWYKVYAFSVGDFHMLIRLVVQTIYISWKRNIQRKIIIFNYTKLWFYIQIKYLIENHCSDQAQKAETVLSAVSLIFVISIDLLDQYQYLGNCPPTPPLAQQQSIDNKLGLMLG